MAAAPVVAAGRLDLGRVISRGLRLLGKRPLAVVLAALAFIYLPAAGSGFLVFRARLPAASQPAEPAPPPGPGHLQPTQVFLSTDTLVNVAELEGWTLVIGGFAWVAQGLIALVVIGEDAAGEPLPVRDILARFLPRAIRLYLFGLLASIAITLGVILFVVPGIMLSLAWMAVPPVAALEDRSLFGAFRRSADLTRNHRGALFVISLLFGLLSLVVAFALQSATGFSRAAQPITTFVFQPLASTVLATVLAAITASAYVELCELKDGAVMHQTAATFG